MGSNAQKLNFGHATNQLAGTRTFEQANQLGKGLPVSAFKIEGGIVTANYELSQGYTLPRAEMPLLMSEYVRLPIQKTDKGVTVGGDVSIDNVSGLGKKSPASYVRPANMGPSAMFAPVAHKDWEKTKPNYTTIYGVSPKDQQAQDKTHGVAIYDQVPSKAKSSLVIDGKSGEEKITIKVHDTTTIITKDNVVVTRGASTATITNQSIVLKNGSTTTTMLATVIKHFAPKILLNCGP